MSWFHRNAAQQPTSSTPLPTVTMPTPPAGATPAAIHSTMMDDYPLTVQHLFYRAQRLFPSREIVTVTAEGTDRTNYGEVCARAQRLASALAKLGVRKGDRVATLGWNTARHYELYLAVPCMGAVLHTLNLRLPIDQLTFIVNDAADKIIFVDADLLPILEKCAGNLSSVERVVVMNGTATPSRDDLPPLLDYEAILADAPADYRWPELDERDACAMCYTSGTTGNPKGVVYSHRSTFLHAMAVTLADTIGLSGNDTVMPIVPMFHVNAWGVPHAAAMVGSKLVLPGRFMDPNRIAQVMADEQVTTTSGVPTIWLGLLQVLAKRPDLDLSHLRSVICGGSAVPASLITAFEQHGLKLIQAWGMTETSPIGTVANLKPELQSLPPDQQLIFRAKQGFPVPGVEIRIINLDTGQEAPWDGETFGEIQIRGPWITGAYYHDANTDQGQSKFMDGWFRTGDVATMDAQGYIQIVDRTKDVIKSGGEWISSVQLESLIMGHPKVLEASVVGLPHPKWQERPVAVVVAKPGVGDLTADEIIEFLQPQVAKWWLPDQILIVEAIPKTSVGKFDKKVLRAQLNEQVKLGE